MSIKTKTAALVMAAVTFGSGMTAVPNAFQTDINAHAYSRVYYNKKTPTVKNAYTSTENDITISWDKISGATGYYVYRRSDNAPAWVRVGSTNAVTDKYTDKRVSAGIGYNYYVVAYKNSGGKRIMSGRSNEISAMVRPQATQIFDSIAENDNITVFWDTVKCSGYEVYYKQGKSDWKLAKKSTSAEDNIAQILDLTSETEYSIRVRAYSEDKSGGKVYSEYSETKTIKTAPDFVYRRSSQYLIDRLNSAKLTKGQNSYELCNRQEEEEEKTVITLSDEDIETIKKFADEHFTDDMTVGEKVDYTVQWLNKNITYADGIEGRPSYDTVWGRTPVDNCFNHKVGQCIQYNSTICAVMTYLGYDARVIQGWRGNSLENKWQHFWCEVTINGTDYVMDSYNFITDGDWYVVCAAYEETAPYEYNSHYIMRNQLMAPFLGYKMN